MRKKIIVLGSLFAGLILIIGILLSVPGLRSRLTNKFDDLRVKVQYALNPPQEAVFVPQQLSHAVEPDELYAERQKLSLAFTLSRGCYATLLVKRLEAEVAK